MDRCLQADNSEGARADDLLRRDEEDAFAFTRTAHQNIAGW